MSDVNRSPSIAMTFVIALGCSAISGYLSWHFAKSTPQRIAVLDNQKVINALNQNPDNIDQTLQQLEQRLQQLKLEGVIVLDAKVVKTPDMLEVMP